MAGDSGGFVGGDGRSFAGGVGDGAGGVIGGFRKIEKDKFIEKEKSADETKPTDEEAGKKLIVNDEINNSKKKRVEREESEKWITAMFVKRVAFFGDVKITITIPNRKKVGKSGSERIVLIGSDGKMTVKIIKGKEDEDENNDDENETEEEGEVGVAEGMGLFCSRRLA